MAWKRLCCLQLSAENRTHVRVGEHFVCFVTSVLFWKVNIRFSIPDLAPRQRFWKVLLFVLCDSRIVITFIVTGSHRHAACCVHTDRPENMSRAERLLPGLEHRPTSQLAPRTKPGISPFTQRYCTDDKRNPVKDEGETGSGSDLSFGNKKVWLSRQLNLILNRKHWDTIKWFKT